MMLRGESRRVPLRTYAFLALTTVATMGFSNASLGYLNYPTQVADAASYKDSSVVDPDPHGSAFIWLSWIYK
jgi:hypothetical protein